MIRTWRLDDGGQTLALASDGGVPWVVHWGAPLAPGEDLAELARAGAGDLSGGMLDALPPLSLCPEARRSFQGQPGLDIADAEGRRRLDDPEDMVRIEVESALQRGKQVIPVLVQGATMPADEALPATLSALAFRMASPLRPDPDFRTDLLRLVDALRAHAQGRTD